MKKHILLKSNLLMIVVIAFCFTWMMYTDSSSYQALVEAHVESIVRMSSTGIKNEIAKSLHEQMTVANSMSKDTMLHSWLREEPWHVEDEAYLQQLYEYLDNYKQEYGYTTVFCVSNLTGNYYYHDGYNKTVHKDDEHDVWYYNFRDMQQEYDIQLDTDESNGNKPTIFVNYRVEDDEGKLLGVVGTAVELTDIQQIIDQYEMAYGMSVYLINRGSAVNSFSQKTDHFVEAEEVVELLGITEEMALTDNEAGVLEWRNDEQAQNCIINTYDTSLKWNLIAVKDTETLREIFWRRLADDLAAVIGILIACISITTFIFFQCNQRVRYYENIDELTGLANRKLFKQQYYRGMRNGRWKQKCLFMFDIDNFKAFNDTKGHLFGNVVLSMVGEALRELTGGKGCAARWGGDEFIGILNCSMEETEQLLHALTERLRIEDTTVTLSIGVMMLKNGALLEESMNQVDQALYKAKKNGKNQLVRVEK